MARLVDDRRLRLDLRRCAEPTVPDQLRQSGTGRLGQRIGEAASRPLRVGRPEATHEAVLGEARQAPLRHPQVAVGHDRGHPRRDDVAHEQPLQQPLIPERQRAPAGHARRSTDGRPPWPRRCRHGSAPCRRCLRFARTIALLRANRAKYAARAWAARRRRSSAGRLPSGSTWRSNDVMNAARARAVRRRESCVACSRWAPMRPRNARSEAPFVEVRLRVTIGPSSTPAIRGGLALIRPGHPLRRARPSSTGLRSR